ncbi:MAG: hypothetical protein A2X49_15685 [Lentisphaerae bacterium GWF2_52_8]|nr:MAG: hypothetical protein A2X49_15685 [Lentisphaerae bacterium GWF2_52_8]
MRMRLFISLAAFASLMLGLMPSAKAQIGITVELNRLNYHQYEWVYARVHLRNYSGHPLAFGESNDLKGRLSFEIEDSKSDFVDKIGTDVPPLEGIILNRGEVKSIIVPISQYYKCVNPGKYTLRAVVEHSLFKEKYQSAPVSFNIITGVQMWERIVGVPDFIKKDPDSKIKTRKYRIESMFDGNNKVYYMIIEDDAKVYSVKRIGFEINNSTPLCEVDSLSRIHIIVQAGAKVFTYLRYDIDGKLEEKEVYFKTDTSPILVRNAEDGTLIVAGGRKARKDLDYQEVEDKTF